MGEVLLWGPIKWLIRGVLLAGLAGGAWIALLYFVRFMRPSNITALAKGELPSVKELQLLGAKVLLQDNIQEDVQEALAVVRESVVGLEDAHGRLVADVESVKGRLVEGGDAGERSE